MAGTGRGRCAHCGEHHVVSVDGCVLLRLVVVGWMVDGCPNAMTHAHALMPSCVVCSCDDVVVDDDDDGGGGGVSCFG